METEKRELLTGNLVQNPVLSESEDGKLCCRFRFAADIYRNGKKSATEFLNVFCCGDIAVYAARCLVKGDRVHIVGHRKYTTFLPKYETEPVVRLTFYASEIEFKV